MKLELKKESSKITPGEFIYVIYKDGSYLSLSKCEDTAREELSNIIAIEREKKLNPFIPEILETVEI